MGSRRPRRPAAAPPLTGNGEDLSALVAGQATLVMTAPLLRKPLSLVRVGDDVEELAMRYTLTRSRDHCCVDLGGGLHEFRESVGRERSLDLPVASRALAGDAFDGTRTTLVPRIRSGLVAELLEPLLALHAGALDVLVQHEARPSGRTMV